MTTWYVWLILFLVFLGLEIMTTGVFFFLCFSTGALFAMLFSLLGASFQVELVVFCAVSLASILLIRPLFKKYIAKQKTETNVDSLIGTKAIVIEDIKVNDMGKVKTEGEIWLAVSNENIAKGETVVIESIDGTKLVVKK
ncbi:NfeD family protein [Candidatus Ruminimicrobiellum ovillum]|uniref:NfeD family protein n=1 Tax=Candidatus Ruminimicrobiellum ovillum TaxID=1947927 RepID=UPI003559C0E1